MPRTLGIDLGGKTIGLAISDELGLTAQGLPTLLRKGMKEDLASVGQLIQRFQVEEVVVGLPRHMDGRLGDEAKEASAFAKALGQAYRVRIILWDERLTTRAAERLLIEAGLRRRKRRKVVDQVAAVLILQGYMDSRPPSKREGDAG